jgi:indole-3-glycerol phosphate synthase
METEHIIRLKQQEVAALASRYSIADMEVFARGMHDRPRGYLAALQAAVEGRRDLPYPANLARVSECVLRSAGSHIGSTPLAPALPKHVDGLSVTTDHILHQGIKHDLQTVRQLSHLPLLQHDYLIDVYQVYEARLLGADAIRLYKTLLPINLLASLHSLALAIGLDVLVVVSTEEELTEVLKWGGAHMICVTPKLTLHTPAQFFFRLEKSFTTAQELADAAACGVHQGILFTTAPSDSTT